MYYFWKHLKNLIAETIHPDAKEKVAFRHLACSKRARRSDRLLTKYFSVKLVVIQFLTGPCKQSYTIRRNIYSRQFFYAIETEDFSCNTFSTNFLLSKTTNGSKGWEGSQSSGNLGWNKINCSYSLLFWIWAMMELSVKLSWMQINHKFWQLSRGSVERGN